MPVITALVEQKERRGRTSVFLDGEFAFGLDDLLAMGLRVGQELPAAEIASLQHREAVESAYQRALHYLSFRPRSEEEMARYLSGKEVPAEAAEEVLARLRGAGLVDDRRFALSWVENRESFRPRARWALQRELRGKGIDGELAEAAVSEVDELAGAMRVGRKALPHVARLEHDLFVRRLLGRLQRRGYGYETARRVVDALWAEMHPEPPDPRARPDHR